MAAKRSTLFTSPISLADFVFRLAFFAVAPFAIVVVAQLFPVRGALIDVGLALLVFVSSEAAHRLARWWSPVPVGSRIRMGGFVVDVTEVKGDGIQLTVDQTIEVEGAGRPAVVARGLYRFYR